MQYQKRVQNNNVCFQKQLIFHQFNDVEFISGYYQKETDCLVLHDE